VTTSMTVLFSPAWRCFVYGEFFESGVPTIVGLSICTAILGKMLDWRGFACFAVIGIVAWKIEEVLSHRSPPTRVLTVLASLGVVAIMRLVTGVEAV
jgi:hypothetical protein